MNPISHRYDFSVIRTLRTREALTLQQLSEQSGVSIAVISKLERNQSVAELDTLYKLAQVFGLSATDLVAMSESNLNQRTEETAYKNNGFSFRKISYKNTDALHVSASKGAQISRPEVHTDNYEICWVLKGSLEMTLSDQTQVMQTGQAIQFDAIQSHTYKALTDVEFLIIHVSKDKRY